MGWEWSLLLLPIAAASGWFAARGANRLTQRKESASTRRYIVGLNYLLNEQPDRAIETLVSLLDVDSETVETHLALGSLFRKRGEVHRALKIHQSLIARPSLGRETRQLAMYELAQDYLAAGVLDRAERVFLELKGTSIEKDALKHLLKLYQQTKEWAQSIDVARRLEKLTRSSWRREISHFMCEMADLAMVDGRLNQSLQYTRAARDEDESNPRPHVLECRIRLKQKKYGEAKRNLMWLLRNRPDLFEVVLPEARELVAEREGSRAWEALLKKAVDAGAGAPVLVETAKAIKANHDARAAGEYLTSQLQHRPSLQGLHFLVSLHLEHGSDKAREGLQVLVLVLEQLMEREHRVVCSSCGYKASHVVWQCPGCKSWGTVHPVEQLSGESNRE